MASDSASPPPRGGLSLYAHLLGPSPADSSDPQPGSQQRDESQENTEAAKKQVNSAFRFQPTKRPQLQAKAKAKKPAFAPPSTWATSSSSPDLAAKTMAQPSAARTQPVPKTTISDWIGDDDDDYYEYQAGEKRQRGGRRKRKKIRDDDFGPAPPNWDAIYDFTRTTGYEEYKGGDEEFQDTLDWKRQLQSHRPKDHSSSDEDEEYGSRYKGGFAPPASYMFAPPPEFNDSSAPSRPLPAEVPDDATGEGAWERRARIGAPRETPPESNSRPSPPPPAPPPAEVPNDTTGEDAYLRRMRMSGVQAHSPGELAPHAPSMEDHDSPAPPEVSPSLAESAPMPREQPPAKPTGRSILDFATISSAAVRYEVAPEPTKAPTPEEELAEVEMEDEPLPDANPLPEPEEPETDEPARSSNRPGQKGFAERYMAKFGYTKGTGLGATGNGIITPLMMKAEKRKRAPDSEGGGFKDRGGRGKIVGGKKAKVAGEDGDGKYGKMSETILLRGMLAGMDLQREIEDGLYQKIGDRCSKYGTIERIFIDRDSDAVSIPVFIKYTNPVSALGAVNALDGKEFEGRSLTPCFFDTDKFEKGIYE